MVGSTPPPYDRYLAIIERLAADSALIEVGASASQADMSTMANIAVDLRVAEGEEIAQIEECRVRALLYEDNVVSGPTTFQHVVRKILEWPLTVGASGETSMLQQEVQLEATWKPEDLFVVAWVQRDTNQEVLNADLRKLGDPTPIEGTSWGSVKARFR